MKTKKIIKNKITNTFGIIFWIVRFIYKILPQIIVLLFVLQIAISIFPFVQNLYFAKFLDDLIKYSNNNVNNWTKNLIILLSVISISSILSYINQFLNRLLVFSLDNNLRKIYTIQISSLDYQHLENKKTSNLIAKVRDEYIWRIRQVMIDILELLSLTVSIGTVMVILIPRYWYLAALILIGEIPSFLIDKKWTMMDWKIFNEFAEKNRQTWDIAWQLTNKTYLIELKINNAVHYLLNKFGLVLDEFTQKRIQLRKNKSPYEISSSLLSIAIIAVCLLVIIRDIKAGLLTVGLFTFYFNTIRQAGDFVSSILNRFISISEQTLYIKNFKKVMMLKNHVTNGYLKKGIEVAPKIEFKNVYFKYPNTKNYVFENLNLTINPNEEIAIIGINGAGKSTLIKLLCRLYDPEKGEILLNDINIKEYDLNYWYQHVSVLFQEFTIYQNLTLRENIAIGNLNKNNDKSIMEALDKSESTDFIKKYKNGLNTIMSQRYGGVEPSWGQWQKIAIARIFHRDTPIMILDEPTASIDANSEYKIFNHLYKQVINKTVIIISHRFSTVRNAQRIIVLDKGKIVEQGSHEDLIKLNGFYAKSFSLQAEGYQ